MNKSNKNKISSIVEQAKPKLPNEESAIHAGGLAIKGSAIKFEKRNRLGLTQDRHQRGQDDGHINDFAPIDSKQGRRIAKLATRAQLLEAANDLLINGGYPELANIKPEMLEPEDERGFGDQYPFIPSRYLSLEDDPTKIAVSHDDDVVGQAIVVRRLRSKNRKGTDPVDYYEGPYPDQDTVTDIIH